MVTNIFGYSFVQTNDMCPTLIGPTRQFLQLFLKYIEKTLSYVTLKLNWDV